MNEPVSAKGRILLVEDDDALRTIYERILSGDGFKVTPAGDGTAAMEQLRSYEFDAVFSDIAMPGLDGLQLLQLVREQDTDLPVVLTTGAPEVATAVRALELGAVRYLTKPVERKTLLEVAEFAVRLCRMARLKREALALGGDLGKRFGDLAKLEASFESALSSLWMAYQPIVDWAGRKIFGQEALVRSNEPSLPHPGALFDAAERLGRRQELGRRIRDLAAVPVTTNGDGWALFVNLHPHDLIDEALYSPSAPLSRIADRVVLEITERASLEEVPEIRNRIGELRRLGYRIAVDDLGAGYAGLSTFAHMQPDVVKLDMSLVRDVHKEPIKRKLVGSMASLCKEMNLLVVAEGIETTEERDALAELRCDLFQGYLFARPGRPFPSVAY